jgi:WD40 repeat protein
MAVEGDSYLLDLKSGERISLGHTRFETVSPDGKWLAYYDTEQEQVAVVDYEGRLIFETPAPQRQLTPRYWLDNQRLLLDQKVSTPGATALELLILNPFTNERQEWHPDFPSQAYANPNWLLYSNLVFNPALTHLIYPALEEDFSIVLWNVQSEQVIRKIYWGSSRSIPRWSPDGRYFVTDAPLRSDRTPRFINFEDGLPYQGGTELFLVNQDGDVQRLTYFAVLQERRQSGYIWARDGHGIAFYSLYWNSRTPDLAYFDLETGSVFDYCETRSLPENYDATLIYPPDIVWSPESDYLAVTFLDDNFRYTVNLVELSTGDAWQIDEDLSAMGWMVSP